MINTFPAILNFNRFFLKLKFIRLDLEPLES